MNMITLSVQDYAEQNPNCNPEINSEVARAQAA